MDSGLDAQLGDILFIPFWGWIIIGILIGAVLFYIILFLMDRMSKRATNQGIKKDFGHLKGIKIKKNEFGIYDVGGRYKKRKVSIRHQTGVWTWPRRMSITVHHHIPDIEALDEDGEITIKKNLVRRDYRGWPERPLKELDELIDRVSDLED